jgi:hypothetical protein
MAGKLYAEAYVIFVPSNRAAGRKFDVTTFPLAPLIPW